MPRATNSIPTRKLKSTLLPYALRACASKEMLYGGIRVQNLLQKPPTLSYHSSSRMKLPSPKQETDAMALDYEFTSMRMMPLNIGNENRYDMSIIRNKDVFKRFLKANRPFVDHGVTANGAAIAPVGLAEAGSEVTYASSSSAIGGTGGTATTVLSSVDARRAMLSTRNRRMYHVNKDQLSVLGADRVGTKAAAAESQIKPAVKTIGSEVFGVGGSDAYMPLQMVKPLQHRFSPAQRTSGLTSPAGRLKQELIDGKGFGWEKKQRKLWQQDISTRAYRPDRFY